MCRRQSRQARFNRHLTPMRVRKYFKQDISRYATRDTERTRSRAGLGRYSWISIEVSESGRYRYVFFLSKIDYNQQRINPRLRGEKGVYVVSVPFAPGSPVHAAKGEKTAIPIVKKRRPKSPVVEKTTP